MATSQNGWPVLTSAPGGKLPWITGRVRDGDVYTVFDYLCRRFDAEVEPIIKAHSWGWAYRAIRGKSKGFSNHASGTAIDLNAPAHPLGKSGTFSSKQRSAIKRILDDLDGVIRWGGDYSGRKDEMHFEINKGTAAVAKVAARIRGTAVAGGTTKPTTPSPAPAPAPEKGILGMTKPVSDTYTKPQPIKPGETVYLRVRADGQHMIAPAKSGTDVIVSAIAEFIGVPQDQAVEVRFVKRNWKTRKDNWVFQPEVNVIGRANQWPVTFSGVLGDHSVTGGSDDQYMLRATNTTAATVTCTSVRVGGMHS